MRRVVFFLVIFVAQILYSQIILQGTVQTKGLNPEPVAGALVELIDQADTTQVLSMITDGQGNYSFQIATTDINDESVQAPNTFQLYQNFPNPFNPSTVIGYVLPHPTYVRIEIYNVLGQKIRTLFDGYQNNTIGRVLWDGTADNGQGVSSGVYIYTLVSDGVRINKKMLLLDGHSSPQGILGSVPLMQTSSQLKKTMSQNYLLRVSGDSLATVMDTLVINATMNHVVSVYRTMTDQDGNIYKIVKIGEQWWMAENLKSTHYRNGDPIPYQEGQYWDNIKYGIYCYYDSDEKNANDYGALYNWYVINDLRNIAPPGWHVASDFDYKELEIFLGMSQTSVDSIGWRGTIEGNKIKESGNIYWESLNSNSTNESGFSARPGGSKSSSSGDYINMGSTAKFWTSTEREQQNNKGINRSLTYISSKIQREYSLKYSGLSIRCIKNNINTRVLTHINITPKADTLYSDETRKFQCTAYYSDGSFEDVSDVADWSITPGSIGVIDNSGFFTINNEANGTETVLVTFEDFSVQTSITIIKRQNESGTLTDIDGNIYRTIKIGDQWWMAENLRVTHYQNGDPITNITGDSEWNSMTSEAFGYYNNDIKHGKEFGALYNWYAANDERVLAPEGWHVPTREEWDRLINYLGGDTIAVKKLKETGINHWFHTNNGTNESGFSALPAGVHSGFDGQFYGLGFSTSFWTLTDKDRYGAYSIGIQSNVDLVLSSAPYHQYGFSIRLVKDSEATVQLKSIEIIIESDIVYTGESQQLTCIASFTDQSTLDVTEIANWSVSPGTAGSIDNYGLFTTHSENVGTETISVEYMGKTAQAEISIIQNNFETGTVTDIDGNVYKTVKIGEQWWMAENFKVTHYRNGDPIPNVADNEEWKNQTIGAYCYYNNDSMNVSHYGLLYNWYAVNDNRNFTPEGWHVPTDDDWKQLEMYLGMSSKDADETSWRGTNEGGKLKETGNSYWNHPNTGATNESGFTALPSGYRWDNNANFYGLSHYAYYWSASEKNPGYSWFRKLYYDHSDVFRDYTEKHTGCSIRLVKD